MIIIQLTLYTQLNSFSSGQGPGTDPCEDGNEPSGPINSKELLGYEVGAFWDKAPCSLVGADR